MGISSNLDGDQQQKPDSRQASEAAELDAAGAQPVIDGIEIRGEEDQAQGHEGQNPVFGHETAEAELPAGIQQAWGQELGEEGGEEDQQQCQGDGQQLGGDRSPDGFIGNPVGIHWVQKLF
jgi:hypothetical protein